MILTELCIDIASRFREWLAEILCHSAIFLGDKQNIMSDSWNFAGMFLYNSI